MNRSRAALLSLIPIAMLSGPSGSPSVTWWIESPLVKIKPTSPVPYSLPRRAELSAARNEFEALQIILHANGRDAADLDVECSDLKSEKGALVSKENITVYLEQFLDITRPSMAAGQGGMWPDPLIPRIDRYAKERRSAFPFSISRGRNQPLWVEVFVPEATHPGKYSGSVRVATGGFTLASVPIHLTVWSFTLPATASLKSSFGLNGTNLLKEHRGKYTNDQALYSLTRVYANAALLHRISIHGGSMVSPKYRHQSGRVQIDWEPYDAEMGPLLNGASIPQGEPLHGAKVTSVELRTPPVFADDNQQAQYWAEWLKHFRQKGWLDRLFLYLWDEPAAGDAEKVLQRGRASLRVDSHLRNLVTTHYNPRLREVVGIWTPLVNCLERKPGFADYCDNTPEPTAYSDEIRKGRSLWFYQSCASHGCNIAGESYFDGWPSYMIDAEGTANRVMQWVAWKYRMEGELYYSMNEAYGKEKRPWESVFLFGGNGDGTLFYPGRPERIGGQTDIPIESIRLKLIREGMEDYEYLALLARVAGKKSADRYADRIVNKTYAWESRADTFLAVRQELGQHLDRLSRGRGDQ